jgi:pimeloyl-ACP methyl ester carboxylesterase
MKNFMISEKIDFKVEKYHLFGTLVKPEHPEPYPVIIFVHWSGPTNYDCSGFYLPIWKRFTAQGYACISWDKPGTGKTKGEYDNVHLFQERVKVIREAIRFLKKRSDIDTKRIGLFGMSQAGWIMPMVTANSNDVSFIIAASCAGESGVKQGAFQIRRHLQLEGLTEEEAQRYGELYLLRKYARTYTEYLKYAKPLNEQKYLREVMKQGEILTLEEFVPYPSDYCQFIDPVPYLEKITCPLLAIWGEKDTAIDVYQAVETYSEAFAKGENKNFQFVVFPETSHFMTRTMTGSLKEWEENKEIIPEFLETMEKWLWNLKKII